MPSIKRLQQESLIKELKQRIAELERTARIQTKKYKLLEDEYLRAHRCGKEERYKFIDKMIEQVLAEESK